MDGDSDGDPNAKDSWGIPAWVSTLIIAVATAGVPSLAGYFAVEKHAQRMKEKEQALAREQFDAEQVAKYLTLAHKDVLTKRAMATYLQAVYFRAGERTLHRWATTQLDLIDEDKHLRRDRLEEAERELADAKQRRKIFTDRRADLEAKLARVNPAKRKDLEAELAEVDARLTAASAEVDRLRAEFEEETRQTLDLTTPQEASRGVCEVLLKATDGKTQQLTLKLTQDQCATACDDFDKQCESRFRVAELETLRTTMRRASSGGSW